MSPVSIKNVKNDISSENPDRKREVYLHDNTVSNRNNNLYRHMDVKLNSQGNPN